MIEDTEAPRKILFLPGAGGSPAFWRPVADRLPANWTKVYFGWPGLGDQPHDPSIDGLESLVRLVERETDGPVDVVAQSMGGVVAARIALDRPEAIRRLVLVVTSAGVNMRQHGASDWRSDYRARFPRAAPWITGDTAAAELPVDGIVAPALLIWGDSDPISPVAVGRHLEHRMPNAKLHIVPGGDHDLAIAHAAAVAALIQSHLA